MQQSPQMNPDDIDQERNEAELARRKDILLDKVIQFPDDNSANPQLLIKSKQKSLYLQTRSSRGSRYRGVSRNGKKWQVSDYLTVNLCR